MKKYKSILLIIIVSLIPLLFTTTIPYALNSRLYINSTRISEHTWGIFPNSYVTSLQQGNQYTITVEVSSFWNMNVGIRIGDTPYMISGYIVDSSGYSDEVTNFMATRTGDYYIQVIAEGSGFFDITIELGITNPPTGASNEFFDVTYLLVLILPCVIIMSIGIFIFILRTKRKKRLLIVPKTTTTINPYKEENKEEKESVIEIKVKNFCQFCGSEIKESLNVCPHCNSQIK